MEKARKKTKEKRQQGKRRSPLKVVRPRIPILVHDREPQDGNIPLVAQFLIAHYSKTLFPSLQLQLPEIPRSLNHQYGTGRGGSKFLLPDVRKFRARVNEELIKTGMDKWQCGGSLAILIVYSSSHWVREDKTIAEKDLDNRVKVLLDAIQDAVPSFRDEAVWDLHAFKQLTNGADRTTIYIFDRGPLVTRTQGL